MVFSEGKGPVLRGRLPYTRGMRGESEREQKIVVTQPFKRQMREKEKKNGAKEKRKKTWRLTL